MERILKYLAIITKVNMDNRPKIVDNETGQFYPICVFDDLKETLQIMATGRQRIRPYLTKWFNDGFTADHLKILMTNQMTSKTMTGMSFLVKDM